MNNWADGKRFLFEDIVIYALVISIAICWDFIVNLAMACSLYAPAHELVHPYHIGTGQWIIIAICAAQLIRKLKDWEYWK